MSKEAVSLAIVRKRTIKCSWCNRFYEPNQIYGYQEGENEKGDVIPRWICKPCQLGIFEGKEEEADKLLKSWGRL